MAYYESQQQGLGKRYLDAFKVAMDNVCVATHRPKIEFPPNIRRYRVAGFPYTILYRQAGVDIEILAVAPHRRRPDHWLDRV